MPRARPWPARWRPASPSCTRSSTCSTISTCGQRLHRPRAVFSGGPLKLIDRTALEREGEPLLERLGVDFDADTPVADLSLAQRQLVEIAKALSLEARLVIMDEPTSSLTVSETDRLLKVIAELKADGVGVIFISHRLDEVERCADRVVVLRDGRVVGELARGEIDARRDDPPDDRARAEDRSISAGRGPPGDAVLEIAGLRTSALPPSTRVEPRRAARARSSAWPGWSAPGRTELARAVFGIDRPLGGELRLDGAPVAITASPRDAIEHGIYLVPEDRKRSGLCSTSRWPRTSRWPT